MKITSDVETQCLLLYMYVQWNNTCTLYLLFVGRYSSREWQPFHSVWTCGFITSNLLQQLPEKKRTSLQHCEGVLSLHLLTTTYCNTHPQSSCARGVVVSHHVPGHVRVVMSKYPLCSLSLAENVVKLLTCSFLSVCFKLALTNGSQSVWRYTVISSMITCVHCKIMY